MSDYTDLVIKCLWNAIHTIEDRVASLENRFVEPDPQPEVKESQVYLHNILNRTDINWLPEDEELERDAIRWEDEP